VSAADRARIRVRRAALNDALRAGDLAVAARAASRLRVRGVHLYGEEQTVARRSRLALGRAVYRARLRHAGEPPRIIREPIPLHPPSLRWRRILAAVLVSGTVVGTLALILVSGLGLGGSSGDNARPATSGLTQVTGISRGRSSAELPIVAVPEPQPSAVPTGTPTPEETGRPGPPGPAGPIVSTGGKVPLQLPGVLPGYVRMTVAVVDDSNDRPLEDVCVIYGTLACGPDEPKTNSIGVWALDVPVTSNPIPWDLRFSFPGYRAHSQQITTRAQDVYVEIRLRRS
jgi:hypothetical protein